MPTLTIGDKKVQVGDDFLKLSPEQQQATVDEIAQQIGAKAPGEIGVKAGPGYGEVGVKAPNAGPGYGQDMLLSIPSGLRSGVESLVGGFGTANEMTGQGASWLAGKLGADPQMQDIVSKLGRFASPTGFMPSTNEIAAATDAGVAAIPGSEGVNAITRYQPKTLPGKIVRTATEIAPSVAMGPGSLVRKGAQTVASSVGGELAGAATEGTPLEPWARTLGMLAGGVVTAGRPGAAKVPRTTTEETLARLSKNKEDAYALSERAGVIIKPAGIQDVIAKIKDDYVKYGFRQKNQPGAAEALAALEEVAGNNVTLKGLDSIRKAAQGGYVMGNKTNNALISKAVERIDELINSNDPNFMAGIDTKIGAQAIDVARKFAHRAFKLETAVNLVKKGNIQADRNITDTRVKSVKSQLAKINDPFSSWGRGFNPAEKEAAAKAARYTPAQRMLHGASVLNPAAGGKLSAAGHIAVGLTNLGSGNLLGLGLQAAGAGVGMGLQKAAEHLAAKSVREFIDLVANGGVQAPVVKQSLLMMTPEKRDAITRSLLAIGGNNYGRNDTAAMQGATIPN